MQSNFTNDDFEQFLKQSADSCRMRPSDKVWKGVSKHLNERKRRVRFATGIFLMAASLVGFYLVDSSKSIHRTTPSTTAEVNHTNASTSGQQPGTNKGAVAPSSASPKQRSAIIRTMPQVKSPITALAEQTTASNDLTAESNTINFLVKEPARVVPLFKGFEQNSSLLADNSATAHLPVAINNDPSHTHEPAAAKAEESATEKEERQLLSIESVTNAYRPIRLKSRFTFQVYFTPTVSYRKLSENKAYLSAAQNAPGAVPNIASFYSVNNAVTHKPDIGLELGFAAKYPLAKKCKTKGWTAVQHEPLRHQGVQQRA